MVVNELEIKNRIIEEFKVTDEYLMFKLKGGGIFILHHIQDCCEWVRIEQIDGDLYDLIGEPLLMAEEVIDHQGDDGFVSTTWTFYKFATKKGYVTIRWCGESNGYYSESVNKTLCDDCCCFEYAWEEIDYYN